MDGIPFFKLFFSTSPHDLAFVPLCIRISPLLFLPPFDVFSFLGSPAAMIGVRWLELSFPSCAYGLGCVFWWALRVVCMEWERDKRSHELTRRFARSQSLCT